MTVEWGIAVDVPPGGAHRSAATWDRLLEDIVDYCEAHALHAGGGAGPEGLRLGVSPARRPWRDASAGRAHRTALLAIIRRVVPDALDAAVTVCDVGVGDD